MLMQTLIAPVLLLVASALVFAVPFAVVAGVLLWMKRPADAARERTRHADGCAERASATGSVKIGPVTHANCARVIEYADGWLVRASWGLVEHWMPKAATRVGPTRRVMLCRQRTLACGDVRVIVYGHLCDFIDNRPAQARRGAPCGPLALAA